jgi:hypothetical protein
MENECTIVSSYGIVRSCDIFPPNPKSSCSDIDVSVYLRQDLQEGAKVYVCNSAIRNFLHFVLPFLKARIVLVSGNSDEEMPLGVLTIDEFQTLISSPKIIRWFCQNFTGDESLDPFGKVVRIPIGMDYHTLRAHIGMMHPWGAGCTPVEQDRTLQAIAGMAHPFNERRMLCYSNFHHSVFGIGARGDRQEAVRKIPREVVYYDDQFTDRATGWKRQSEFMFVLSPRGGGPDCHRTWEALALGCVPVLKSSGLDPLFENLPVLIVKDWSDITAELLRSYKRPTQSLEKTKLAFWQRFFSKPQEHTPSLQDPL